MTDRPEPPAPNARDTAAIIGVYVTAAALNIIGFVLAVAFPLTIAGFAAQADAAGSSFTARQSFGAALVMAGPLLLLVAASTLVRGLRRQLIETSPVSPH